MLNCLFGHRWLYTPRSSAILYVAPQNQHLIRTTHPTSWGFVPLSAPEAGAAALTGQPNTGKTRFETLFEFVATSDDSPYLCVPEALEFRERVCGGEENVYAYLDKLALEGGDVVAEILDTEVLQENGVTGQDSRFRRCSMVNVRLPLKLKVTKEGEGDGLSEEEIQSVMRWLGETFVREYGTFVPVFRYGGALWTRLSAQVYLEKKDFEWLGGVLLEVCKRVMRREFSS